MPLDPGKWQWKLHPDAVPEACILCTAQRHPRGFLRAVTINRPGVGATWFCAGCFEPAAEALGMLSVPNVGLLHGQLEEMSGVNEELHAKLEEAKAAKVVPLRDVMQFYGDRETELNNSTAAAIEAADKRASDAEQRAAIAEGKVIDLTAERAKRRPEAAEAS